MMKPCRTPDPEVDDELAALEVPDVKVVASRVGYMLGGFCFVFEC